MNIHNEYIYHKEENTGIIETKDTYSNVYLESKAGELSYAENKLDEVSPRRRIRLSRYNTYYKQSRTYDDDVVNDFACSNNNRINEDIHVTFNASEEESGNANSEYVNSAEMINNRSSNHGRGFEDNLTTVINSNIECNQSNVKINIRDSYWSDGRYCDNTYLMNNEYRNGFETRGLYYNSRAREEEQTTQYVGRVQENKSIRNIELQRRHLNNTSSSDNSKAYINGELQTRKKKYTKTRKKYHKKCNIVEKSTKAYIKDIEENSDACEDDSSHCINNINNNNYFCDHEEENDVDDSLRRRSHLRSYDIKQPYNQVRLNSICL